MKLVSRTLDHVMARIYDRFMAPIEDACLARWRAQLLGEVRGRVLEIGVGTGINLQHYPAEVDLELTLTAALLASRPEGLSPRLRRA